MTKLNDWMVAKNKSTSDLADAIGRERTRAHRIRKGALPNKEEARAIVEWTDGALILGDFYDDSPAESGDVGIGADRKEEASMSQSP